MDQALLLKKAYDYDTPLTDELIEEWLVSSELIKTLTADFSPKGLFPIWRLLALAEIPYTARLPYTEKLIAFVEKTYATEEGFSITGKVQDILPCYNAMILEAFSKLGLANSDSAKAALNWIQRYQSFERGEATTWTGKGIQKYGGCLKDTSCFIGIAKSVKALIYFQKHAPLESPQDALLEAPQDSSDVNDLIHKGTAYLLNHNLFQRLSDQAPITKHILDIAYPQSYQLNIQELLEIMYKTDQLNDPRVKPALTYIQSKMTQNQDWKINYIYKAEGYVSFDRRGISGEWISYLFETYLDAL